jgi:hypothetical protein
MILRLPNPMSAVVWLAFFIPASFFGGWTDRAFGVAVFLLACAVLPAKPSPWEARKPSAQAFKIFLLLEFLYAVSAVYSAAFNGIQIGPQDYFELLRYVFLGAFVVYLIRHYDAHVRTAVEWAMVAALYFALLFPSADPQGYVSIMTLCYLLFFSRLRLRFLHAATALLVVFFSGARSSWTAALLIVSAALSVRLYQGLVRSRKRYAFQLSLIFCVLLLASPAAYVRASRAAARAPSSSSEVATMQFIRRSPLFGWGPAEDAEIPGRSQYLFWMLKGSALGAGLILAALLLVGGRLLRAASGNSMHLAGAAAFLGSVALMLSTGRFLESFRLFFLTSFFMAGIFEASR